MTGEALYSNDLNIANCLHLAYVMSPIARGRLGIVDTTTALTMPGVRGYIDWRDVPGSLVIGHWGKMVFAKDQVEFHGDPIGAIVADSHEAARRAAAKVKVECERETPIISIEVS